MKTAKANIPRIVDLAGRIEGDIRARKLQPGDAYLPTSEVAQMLGVGTVAANRALQLLAKRRLLSRRQGRGAVIDEGIMTEQKSSLKAVHFLVHQEYLRKEGLLADGVIVGMQGVLPGADVQMNFLRPGAEGEVAERVIAGALRSGQPEGLVLVRTPLAVQRAVQASGLPAVVHGMLYPSVQGIPWIDRDHRQAARLLVERFLTCGHRRLVYVAREQVLPGDYPFMDGLVERMAEARLPLGSLVVRRLPLDQHVIEAEVRALLQHAEGVYSGILGQTEPFADAAAAAAESLGLAVGRDVIVAVAAVYRPQGGPSVRYPNIRNNLSPERIGEHLARMLLRQLRDQHWKPNHEILPVALEEPAGEET